MKSVSSSGLSTPYPASPPMSAHTPHFGAITDAEGLSWLRTLGHTVAPVAQSEPNLFWQGIGSIRRVTEAFNPLVQVYQATGGIVNHFIGHGLRTKEQYLSSKLQRGINDAKHALDVKQNYLIGATATGVLLAGTIFAVRGMAWYNAKRLSQQLEGAFEKEDFQLLRQAYFKNIIGHNSAKQHFNELLSRLEHPEFSIKGNSNSMLMSGPPGTGKTQLVRAFANNLQSKGMGSAAMYSVHCDKLVGEPGTGPRIIGALHQQINACPEKHVVVFMDEVDSLGSRDALGAGSEGSKTINALLQMLDGFKGFKDGKQVTVLYGTNRIQDIDSGIMSRIRKKVVVGAPNPKELADIYRSYLVRPQTLDQGHTLTLVPPKNLSFNKIIAASNGFTGRSAENAVKNLFDTLLTHNAAHLHQQMQDTLAALPSPPPPTLYQQWFGGYSVPKTTLGFKLPFTEEQLLAAIHQVKGDSPTLVTTPANAPTGLLTKEILASSLVGKEGPFNNSFEHFKVLEAQLAQGIIAEAAPAA